jgi:hypothetical protein
MDAETILGGYVPLYRKLLDHPLMNQLPAAWFRVFVAILLKVNWKPGRWWDGSKDIIVPPGSMITFVEKLSKITHSSVKQVRGCLQYLSTANIAAIQTTTRYTAISLLNWQSYRDMEKSEGKPNGKAEGEVGAKSGQGEGKVGATIKEFNQGNQGNQENNGDLDSSQRIAKTAIRREGGTPPAGSKPKPASICKEYPRLQKALTAYMAESDDKEAVIPGPRTVVDIVKAAGGASENEIIECLRYLHNERGLMPGTKYGPRTFSWFKTTIADYFQQKRKRDEVVNPATPSYDSGKLSKAEFDDLTSAIE